MLFVAKFGADWVLEETVKPTPFFSELRAHSIDEKLVWFSS